MAIKDSIVNLKKGLRTTLTNVPALIDTLVRGLDGVEAEVEKGEIYSTEEQEIGTWTDGSKLYTRYVDFGAIPSSTSKDLRIEGIDIKEIVGTGFAADYTMPIPFVYQLGDAIQLISIYAVRANIAQTNKDTIRMVTNSDRTGFTAYVKIKYTKVSATRSPEENDTKNGGDEESTFDPGEIKK